MECSFSAKKQQNSFPVSSDSFFEADLRSLGSTFNNLLFISITRESTRCFQFYEGISAHHSISSRGLGHIGFLGIISILGVDSWTFNEDIHRFNGTHFHRASARIFLRFFWIFGRFIGFRAINLICVARYRTFEMRHFCIQSFHF